MAIADDFSVNASGDIRHSSGTATYTVLELHRYLQDLADNASASGDDVLDITSATPSERSTDNIITLNGSFNIDDTAAEYLYDGSITQASGDVIYAGLVVVGSVESGTELQVVQNNAVLTSHWGTDKNANAAANIITRFMVKVRNGGADIDGRRLRVTSREWGDTYAEFSLTCGLGNNTAAVFTSVDLNNSTSLPGGATNWTDNSVAITQGFQNIDITNDGNDEEYYVKFDKGSMTKNDVYEYAKYIQRRGTSEAIFGMSGDLFRGVTHQIPYDNEAVSNFSTNETVSWTGGSGAVLAVGDDGTTGDLYIQLLNGTAPSDGTALTGGTSGTTADVNGSVTSRTISSVFLGVSTGTSLIGAYGVGFDPTDLDENDQLFDLSNTLRQPPNFVTFTVSGLVSGEDRVLVGNDNSGSLDLAQFTLNTALTSASETSVVVNTTIPTDTPESGTIRIQNADGAYVRVAYSSYTGSTFTITSTDFSGSNAAVSNNVFISYIDEVASGTTATFTTVYSSDRTLFVRVRDGGGSPIKTFETAATLGDAGGTTSAIRTADT